MLLPALITVPTCCDILLSDTDLTESRKQVKEYNVLLVTLPHLYETAAQLAH